jgi:rod shape-determining protein MreC
MMIALRFRSIALTLILAALLFFVGKQLVHFTGAALDTGMSVAMYSLIRIHHAVLHPFKNMYNRIQTVAVLQEQLAEVQNEKEALQEQLSAAQSVNHFVQETQELVTFQKRYNAYNKQLAQIILKQFSNQVHFFLVDVGAKHGAMVDMVAVYKNCLIGRVSEVFPYYSKVTLITDKSCKVAALCATTKTSGIYEGNNDKEVAALKHVSHLDPLKKDDLLISSGQGLVFPRGFGLGKIKYFEVEGVNYSIVVTPLIDLSKLSYCYLMRKGEEQ